MGGLFSAPKPPPPPPPPPLPLPPLPDPEEEERQRRIDAIERRRRGRSGTIATSERGLLAPAAGTAGAKTLLGE